MALRFVIIGGGPAGNTAATHAARLGAEVTVDRAGRDRRGRPPLGLHPVEGDDRHRRRAGGGGPHRRRWASRGAAATVDPDALKARIEAIEQKLEHGVRQLLDSQGVRILRGTRPPHRARTRSWPTPPTARSRWRPTPSCSPPAAGRGSPTGPTVDGERVLSTRDAYPPPTWPEHLVVIGSGVTGVEFVHMFSSLGSEVTLIVSRQQVLPQKDSEVAAALEDELLRRGVRLLKGARAVGIDRADGGVAVRCDDGRTAAGQPRPARHRLGPQQRGPRPRRGRRGGRRRRLRAGRRGAAAPTSRTSTRPVTCRGSCRCRRWRPCRVAASPST